MKIKFPFKKKKILWISDMHIPYQHPDAIKFLQALQKKYKYDLIVSVGDLADFHNISFHKSDPDLAGAGDELRALRKQCKVLEKIFPKMIIVGSNHGDLPMRKFLDAGLPMDMLRPYNEIYGVGKGWQFVDDLTIEDGREVIYVAHGISKSAIKVAAQRGVHHVCGHYHTEYRIDYVSNPRSLLWAINTGCLIDRKSYAFNYNKLDLSRPIIGVADTLHGLPNLRPMVLNEEHEWIGAVP